MRCLDEASTVELDPAGDPVCEPAEVGARVVEEIDPGRDQQDAPDRPLRRDPAEQPSALRVRHVNSPAS